MKQATANQRLTAEERHKSLAEEVRMLERRAYLTPEEQRHITELKKQKLLAKDELFALRREG
jgi:uncharacterized protein YdcH (DUF465 family)